jgi:hypothetical protein
MSIAFPFQKFQDWFSQQWVIWRGRKLDFSQSEWLLGPFGNLNGIGKEFIQQLADKENLMIVKTNSSGLISDMKSLINQKDDFDRLDVSIIDFYQNTASYELDLTVKWNSFFRFFGWLLKIFFSNRINQLNIPLSNKKNNETLESEIIQLIFPDTKKVKYTFWIRSLHKSQKVIYTGIYGITELLNGETYVKTIFPLPNGSATVLLKPTVNRQGDLILDASGNHFGDAGFYFLMKDSKEQIWSRYIPSFKDKLQISFEGDKLIAKQMMKLWGMTVVDFEYLINKKKIHE